MTVTVPNAGRGQGRRRAEIEAKVLGESKYDQITSI